MTTFNVNGKTYETSKIPLHLGCEAERMLKVQLGEGGFVMTMIELYVAIRLAEPELPPHIVADRVSAADFLDIYDVPEEEAAEVPLDETEQEGEGDATPPTSGLPVSASSA